MRLKKEDLDAILYRTEEALEHLEAAVDDPGRFGLAYAELCHVRTYLTAIIRVALEHQELRDKLRARVERRSLERAPTEPPPAPTVSA